MLKLANVKLLLVSWSCLAAVAQAKSYGSPDLDIDSDNAIVAHEDTLDPFASCEIYCYGNLLHTIQMASPPLFSDSKTFVDMTLKNSPDKTLADFNAMMEAKNNTPSRDDLKIFVDEYFGVKGTELESWEPTDWKENPKFLDLVSDPDLKQWGMELNNIWKKLGRKMKDDVKKNPQHYSIIPVPNPVIIPGGRFIEFYYWDSYWIIRGLLYSEMYNTARGMIENFLSIVNRIGFIPNGGRVYYHGRSQPPLLTGMVKSYVEFTNDDLFAINALEDLEHEFEYFVNNHTVEVKNHSLCVYRDSSSGPRPESYSEDFKSAAKFESNDDKERLYTELKAAAESGMDFSTRWFISENGTNEGNLTNLSTTSIVPVDLNAYLYWNAKMIAEFHSKAGNTKKVIEYENKAEKLLLGIQEVLWNEEVGCWLDYDMKNEKPRNYFVSTNLSPLWAKAFNISDTEKISAKIMAYIEKNKLDTYPGGVPNTLATPGEQWDFPNVWAPMQYIVVEGLNNLNTPEAKNMSKKWATRWVKSNFKAYTDNFDMYEKYNAEVFGGHGTGGEYEVQTGFGWSNGVIIEWLSKHGRDISTGAGGGASAVRVMSVVGVAAVTIVALIAGRVLW
ncbi:trehalase isoform X1 [Drosophila elegans]|uniref:trehalase isoform X1 n=1 Tax=Drosophila elegans TaxID=30023 RepID=UPI001BC85CC8|nr:trehalase isoform X1 [Drosophila elegans]XP_041565885.1 trehalase isoform X1 [Drosophila elegans]XP_041565886.1 trehalase isoform X1 [Drosophila elegans]XP_041565887.1 trehalase isoform X1 [Drosophila elegans]